jgi:hypothetical protein
MMDCRETRRRLWSADVLCVSDAEVEGALEHAEACPACEGFLEADRRVARLIRESILRVRAPREFRERLYAALARERGGAGPPGQLRYRWGKWSNVALSIFVGLALGMGGSWLVLDGHGGSAATAFADGYLRRVIEQEVLPGADSGRSVSSFPRR